MQSQGRGRAAVFWRRGLEEAAQVGRKLEADPAVRGDNLVIGQAGVEFYLWKRNAAVRRSAWLGRVMAVLRACVQNLLGGLQPACLYRAQQYPWPFLPLRFALLDRHLLLTAALRF
jgi:hypothetical protein